MLDTKTKQFLHVLYCATNNLDDVEGIKNEDMTSLLELSKNAGLSSFVDEYLEKQGVKDPEFMKVRDTVVAHHIMAEEIIKNLLDQLEEKQIKHILLQNLTLHEIYPEAATREFGYVDIYINKEHQKHIEEILFAQGFRRGIELVNGVESYRKNYLQIKVHYAFVHGGLNKYWTQMNQTFLDHAQKVSGKEYQYELSVEDEYIYDVMDAFRHHVIKALGIQFLLDIWYYTRCYPEEVHSSYVRDTLKNLELKEFEERMMALSEALFTTGINQSNLDELQEKEIHELLITGAKRTNTQDGQIITDRTEVQGKNWVGIYLYSLNKLNENDKWYAFNYPFAYHHKWARPFVLLHTSAKRVLKNPLGILLTYGKD